MELLVNTSSPYKILIEHGCLSHAGKLCRSLFAAGRRAAVLQTATPRRSMPPPCKNPCPKPAFCPAFTPFPPGRAASSFPPLRGCMRFSPGKA